VRDLLPPLLHLGTGLGLVIFGFAAFRLGAERGLLWVRLQLVGLLIIPFALQVMAQGAAQSTLGRAAPTLAIGAGLVLLAALFVAGGMLVGRKA